MNFHTRFPRRAFCSAYILLEVMLATGIFALAGVSLAVVLSKAISAGTSIQRDSHIAWRLESMLNETRVTRLQSGRETAKPDANGISYEKEISRLDLKNDKQQSLANLYEVKITAHWKEQNRDMRVVSQTYVYQP